MESADRLQDTFDLMEFWRAIKRRQRTICIFTISLVLLAVAYCLVATRRYSATGTIEVRRDSRDSLGLDTALGVSDAGTGDSLAINIESQTEAGILQSDGYALRVIDELHLEDSPDFKGSFNLLGKILGLFSPKNPNNSAALQRQRRLRGLVATFENNLKVTPTPGTRLIEVVYKSKDPETAKAVVDRLVLDLVNSSSDQQRDANSSSSKFMEEQLTAIRTRTENLQAEVVKMQQQAGIVSLGTTTGDGKDQAYSEILDELEQIGTTLGQAQTNRILKGAVYDQIKQGNPELISISNGNLNSAAAPGIAASLQTIQSLRLSMTTDQALLAQLEDKFGPGYPKLEETKVQIASYQQQIDDEISRMRERAKNDYEVAVKTEEDSRNTYAALKAKADSINSSAIGFAIAKEEAASSRKLYEDLLSRSKEAEVLQGLKPSNVRVVSPAMAPTDPSAPKIPLILAGSLFLGLTMGTGLALLADLSDKRIVSTSSIQFEFGRPPVVALPVLSRSDLDRSSEGAGLVVGHMPRPAYAEEVSSLANSLFLSKLSPAPRLLVITSPGVGEGKTLLSANLALLLAQRGKKILLVDADLRHPGVHRFFKLDNSRGLADIFTPDSTDLRAGIRDVVDAPGLSVLTTGDLTRISNKVFSFPQFTDAMARLQHEFDCVLIDSAPVLAVNDCVPIISHADVVLLMARMYQTNSQDIRDSIAKLEQFVPSDGLKLVINGIGAPSGMRSIYHGAAK